MPTLRFTYSGVSRTVENPSLIKPGQICGLEVMKGGTALEQVKRYWVDRMEDLEFPGIGVPGPEHPRSRQGAPEGDGGTSETGLETGLSAPDVPTPSGSPAVRLPSLDQRIAMFMKHTRES